MVAPPGTLILDVSSLQGPIDWAKVSTWRSPDGRRIAAVYARATLGTIRDSRYLEYRKGAKAAGLLFGAYGVLRPYQSTAAQIQAFLDTIGDLESGEMPPALDFELEDGTPGGDVEHKAAIAWVNAVMVATWRRPIIYTGRWFWQVIGDLKDSPLSAFKLWVASYTKSPLIPRAWKVSDLWQYKGNGGEHVEGIGVDVDRDVFQADANGDGIPGTYEDLIAFIEQSKLPANPEIPRAPSEVPDLRDALEKP